MKELPIVAELKPDKIMPKLLELEKSLVDHNPEAMNLLNEIGSIKDFEKQIKELKKAVAKYDFDATKKLLGKSKIRNQIKSYKTNC